MPRQTKAQLYRKVLIKFMSHKEVAEYAADHQFTDEELAAIVPDDIVRYMKLKAYGNPDANTETDHPTEGRSSSVEFYKKAISFFIPMRNATWNPMAGVGNPTRSVAVNELIKAVKKAEVRKQGKPSQARRELEEGEFVQTDEILNRSNDPKKRFMAPAAGKFQFHMVARVDDVAHFEEEDLKPNPEFDFALLSRMGWSKNVLEERDAPDQIILGSFNSEFCCMLGLAIYLEWWKEVGHGDANKYLFGDKDDPDRNKAFLQDTWKEVWDGDEFIPLAEGPIGGHSRRKQPATYARRQGCDKDDIDSRGRWRKRRVQDRYVSANLPFPDAKVAAALCVGGPCKYELVEGSGVTEAWLRVAVVPNIIAKDGITDRVALVLALPLLWAAMSPEMENRMPATTRNRIQAAYGLIRTLEEGVNPVQKRLLIVSGGNARVHITVAPGVGGNNGAGGGNAGQYGEGGLMALSARVHAVELGQISIRQEMNHNHVETTRRLETVNRNVQRIAVQPGVRQRAAGNGATVGMASLAPNLRSLHALWQEYTVGIGGRKPASRFTAPERGRVKYLYHRRKVVWDVIARLVRGGRTAQVAIDMIYNAYGHAAPSVIINRMRRDKAVGGHPNLQH